MTSRILSHSHFGSIGSISKQLSYNSDYIDEFIDHINSNYGEEDRMKLIANFSSIYVLVGNVGTDVLCKDGEAKWKDVLTSAQYDTICFNKYMVIGYILIDKESRISEYSNIHAMSYIGNILKSDKVNAYMMAKMFKLYKAQMLPLRICDADANFWLHYLLRRYAYDGLYMVSYIDKFIKKTKLDTSKLDWDALYDICIPDVIIDTLIWDDEVIDPILQMDLLE